MQNGLSSNPSRHIGFNYVSAGCVKAWKSGRRKTGGQGCGPLIQTVKTQGIAACGGDEDLFYLKVGAPPPLRLSTKSLSSFYYARTQTGVA